MASAFDAIASKPTPSKKKSDLAVAETTKDIAKKVSQYIVNKAELKRLEAEQGDLEGDIIAHVRPQQDEMAYCGTFVKSLHVPGANDDRVTYVTSDRFSVPQEDDAQAEIKKLLGPKKYDEFFDSTSTIAIHPDVLKDEKTLNKIAAACEKAGLNIGEIFTNTVKIVATKGLDEKQYQLPKTKLNTWRTLVRQAKPALK